MSQVETKTGTLLFFAAGAALGALLLGVFRGPLSDSLIHNPFASDSASNRPLHVYDADEVQMRVLSDKLTFSQMYVPVDRELKVLDGAVTHLQPTLVIRNTSDSVPLYVEGLRLYGRDGKKQRSYLKHTLEIAPFASVQFDVAAQRTGVDVPCALTETPVDPCAAALSHFVVSWAAPVGGSHPIIETIMLDEDGRVSHVRDARPISSLPGAVSQVRNPRAVQPPALPPLAANLAPQQHHVRPHVARSEPEYELVRYDSDFGLRAK